MVHLRRGDGHARHGLQAVEQAIDIAQSLGTAPALVGIRATHAQLRDGAARAGEG
jgi:hypothetical protein